MTSQRKDGGASSPAAEGSSGAGTGVQGERGPGPQPPITPMKAKTAAAGTATATATTAIATAKVRAGAGGGGGGGAGLRWAPAVLAPPAACRCTGFVHAIDCQLLPRSQGGNLGSSNSRNGDKGKERPTERGEEATTRQRSGSGRDGVDGSSLHESRMQWRQQQRKPERRTEVTRSSM